MTMKKLLLKSLSLLLILTLTACAKYPDTAADGTAWDKDWEMLGTVLGVETPKNNFTLLENDSVLTGDDAYFATWVTGELTAWVNEDGKDTDLYPAQIYLLLYGFGDEAAAEEAMADFISREEASYTVRERVSDTYNGQEYTILLYDCGSETNPYSRGASAFAIYKNYVVSAELTCTESYQGDEHAQLADFLNGCHYADT